MAHAARAGRSPSTAQGRRAVRLVVAGLVLVGIAVAVALLDGPWFFGPVGFVGLLAIAAAGAYAVVAVLRGDRSPLVLMAIPLWLVVLFLLIGELAGGE